MKNNKKFSLKSKISSVFFDIRQSLDDLEHILFEIIEKLENDNK